MSLIPASQAAPRLMTEDDLPAVLALERGAHPHPWSAEQFRRELSNPAARVVVLELDGAIAGFLCWWLVAGEAEIQNVVTAPAFRRRGVARRLLEYFFASVAAAGATRAMLEVRTGNLGAIALYRAFDFVGCGVRRRYYADGEDAILMEKDLARQPGQELA